MKKHCKYVQVKIVYTFWSSTGCERDMYFDTIGGYKDRSPEMLKYKTFKMLMMPIKILIIPSPLPSE